MSSKRLLLALGGPLLILSSVLVVLHDYAFLGEASMQTGDLLRFFSVRFCYLGDQLGSGTLPLWNPYSMGGTPFIGDPLSGWGYLPPMIVAPLTSCETTIRTITVLNPILAGLGLYWFGRSERFGRIASTIGGLVLALSIAGSATVQQIQFAGALAWTALALAATSRFFHAARASSRLVWIAITAVLLSQVAAAFLSFGIFVATGVLGTYVLVTFFRANGEERKRVLIGSLGILVAGAAVSMAYLLPGTQLRGRHDDRPGLRRSGGSTRPPG